MIHRQPVKPRDTDYPFERNLTTMIDDQRDLQMNTSGQNIPFLPTTVSKSGSEMLGESKRLIGRLSNKVHPYLAPLPETWGSIGVSRAYSVVADHDTISVWAEQRSPHNESCWFYILQNVQRQCLFHSLRPRLFGSKVDHLPNAKLTTQGRRPKKKLDGLLQNLQGGLQFFNTLSKSLQVFLMKLRLLGSLCLMTS